MLVRPAHCRPTPALVDARGLIARPAVLMLAELRNDGMTILLVDQMAAPALSVAERAYLLQSGAIRQSGRAADLRSDPAVVQAYFGEQEQAGLRDHFQHVQMVVVMDLIVRNARVIGNESTLTDIGIDKGRIAVIRPTLQAEGETLDLGGRLVTPGFIETHIHLDKSRILGRCKAEKGDLEEAIGEVARQKQAFTAEDVCERAKATLERAILNGTTHMRTHLEVDPGIGLRGLEGVRPLVEEYKWAIDLQICIFPQEGLTNNPGTDELMVEALKNGGSVVGAAPYTDSNPHGQIDRVFAIAREFDIDIDMHLDLAPTPDDPDLLYVCDLAERFKWGGRVAIGHVTKLSAAPPEFLEKCARRMADAGVALTVLPSTDLYLMGRHMTHSVMRGVTEAHKLLHHGVNCSLSTNNVLNPFTPFGDCSLVRMANLYANVCQVGSMRDTRECLNMVTTRSAKLLNLADYGVEAGKPADLAVLDAESPEQAVAELAPVLYAFKRGRRTATRAPAVLHRPA